MEPNAPKNLVQTTGKRPRSGPGGDYTQVTAYIPKQIHCDVMKLVATAKYNTKHSTNKAPDFSDLVAVLLENWLKEQHRESSAEPTSSEPITLRTLLESALELCAKDV